MNLMAVDPNAHFEVSAGAAHPVGATVLPGGVNFSLFSTFATGVELLLFAKHDDPQPFQVVTLNPFANKTFHFWHVFVEELPSGVHYAYRVDGLWDPGAGLRFNRSKVLIDPYAKGNTKSLWKRENAFDPQDNVERSMRSVVLDTSAYDWEGDRPLDLPMEDTVIYEIHARGFTKSPSSGVKKPGTFGGVVEKIPHLQELGVTAVELLPVFDFDGLSTLRIVDGQPLHNFWGYDPIGFFAPHSSCCISPESGRHLDEFRDMVKALHKAGIAVILDVVFNHTGEGNEQGPVFCFKGIDNHVYYFLDPNDRSRYSNYSGTGNTVNCNHPIVQKLIIESLKYWVREGHVDGFRFDEGSILSRGEDGQPLEHPPVVWQIELDEDLANTKVIAEAWDAAGLYQIGHFPGDRWSEWNGQYRDDVRRFVRGDAGMIAAVASRLSGSADLYQGRGALPVNSINFVTCHDGFTMNDLVSYDCKHNEANGEGNRDGIDENCSWNCGVEGETSDPAIEALRVRQIKNFATILLLSRGVPMILGGDEFRRTQRGNNNPYCQDNEISWVDWTLAQVNVGLLRFWKGMIRFRKSHQALRLPNFFTGKVTDRGLQDVSWHSLALNSPAWNDPNARAFAMTVAGIDGDSDLHVMLNMDWNPHEFEIPLVAGRKWFKAIDTARNSPDDIADPGKELAIDSATCPVEGRSIAVLISR
jgi:isoamylase